MKASFRKIPVLYENDFCMVLDKPSGLPVQGGKGVKTSLDSILSQEYSPRPLLVHRLDRDTSGLILVAKDKKAAASLSALLNDGSSACKNRIIAKQYLCVCANSEDKAFGDAYSNVKGAKQGAIRLDLDVGGKRKKAETFYRLVETAACALPGNLLPEASLSCSLLEIELGTGRMHQIRRHLALLGHPLLGDDKYGDFALNRRLKAAGLKRLLLHASRLVIRPVPGLFPEGLELQAPLPDYFAGFLEGLKLFPAQNCSQ